MSRPRIGVTLDEGVTTGAFPLPRHELKQAYSQAVIESGGVPLLLAPTTVPEVIAEYLAQCHGLLVTGGAFDVPPDLYGEAPREGLGELRPARTTFESTLIAEALARNLPVLGICGGMQLLNVALGGSLFQDIGREIPGATSHEQQTDRREPAHTVEVSRGSRLADAVGSGSLLVNSTHHQAVHRVGKDLVCTARAPDGVIEAVESSRHRFALGVQWHPELLLRSAPANAGVYRELALASAQRAESSQR